MNRRVQKQMTLAGKLPVAMFARWMGIPPALPVNVTLSLLYSCNSRCQTCRVYEKTADRLSVEECERIFQSLGHAPFWFTFSGGEPFLRQDIVEICHAAYTYCKPAILNIPTNASLSQVIPERVEQIVRRCPETMVIVNVSLDDIGERHDAIRNLPHSFEEALITYRALKALTRTYSNFTVGIHTVISRFNVERIPAIYEELRQLEPDSYITEIAEERVELGTIGREITPSLEQYARAVGYLSEQLQRQRFSGVSTVTQAFRLEYYRLVTKILAARTQVIPCYAGILSAQIAPQGDVWPCCVRADVMGNLRENHYNFRAIWHSAAANRIRKSIRNKACFCPLANASYTNMLCSPTSMLHVIRHLL